MLEFVGVFAHLDLLVVGVVVAFMAVLGAVVYFSNPSNSSNLLFLLFCFCAIFWSVLNYLFYQVDNSYIAFWLMRGVISISVWFIFTLFLFLSTFPLAKTPFRKDTIIFATLISFGVSVINLSPLVFKSIGTLNVDGSIATINNGPGIVLYGVYVFTCFIGGIFSLILRFRKANQIDIKPIRIIFLGILITFTLLLTNNLVLPAFFDNSSFVKYGALSIFPFILATAIALLRYKFLNAKAVTVAILTAFLAIIVFGEVIFSTDVPLLIFRLSEFVLVLTFGVLLIKGVTREVEQREQIQVLADRLEKANARLKELDTLKSQFLSLATHELRAPLTIVRNFISLVMEGAYGKLPVAAEEGLQKVFERATEMTHSIDNYLNVSRIEQGRMKYDFSDVDIVAMVKSAFEAHKPEAEKKGLKYTMSLAVNAVMVKIDKEKINEVLNNLIDNAIKYTPEGNVYISVESSNGKFRFSVKDSGVGMSKDTIDTKLFKLFSTAANSKSINMSSTGIGLFVSKSHVEACGGKIWAESEGEGKGSTFIVEFSTLKK